MRDAMRTLCAAILAAGLLLAPSPGHSHGVERSRGDLLELIPVSSTQVFKHNASLDRVDTDSYPGELQRPLVRADGRYYLLGLDIYKIGNDNDNLAFFAGISPPEVGMVPVSLASCGARVCVVFAAQVCSGNFKIGGYAPGTTPIFSASFDQDDFCVRDIVDQPGRLIVMQQANQMVPGRALQTRFTQFNEALVLLHIQTGPTLERTGQAMARHRTDPDSVFVLDTDGGGFNRILRISVSTGGTIASSLTHAGEGSLSTLDITHFSPSNEVVLLRSSGNLKRYTLTGFADGSLALVRERAFTY
jgi:hypothetical protein